VARNGARASARLCPLDWRLQLRSARIGSTAGGSASAAGVDQVQFSPFEYRRALLEGAHQRNILMQAYSPPGTGRHLSNQTVRRIAASIGRTSAQLLLRWSVQHDLVVIPKSTHRERIEENALVFDFTLSDEDMKTLDALDRSGSSNRTLERTWW
jgi:diketogulonate reductase-like aldo/keto reductase